jgi:hypothetical protein
LSLSKETDMKAAASNSQVTESELAVPSEIIVVAALLGIAIGGTLAHAGMTVPAMIFLGLSLVFVVVAGMRRKR